MSRIFCAVSRSAEMLILGLTFVLAASPLAGQQFAATADCADPVARDSAACRSAAETPREQGGNADNPAVAASPEQSGPRVYVDSAGLTPVDRSREKASSRAAPEPPTDLQRLAQQSTGTLLPIFGRSLFDNVPSTFAPANQTPAINDHILGPGDEILLRTTGHDAANDHLTVDQSGSIYIPQVGTIHVAGTRFADLEAKLNAALAVTLRNYHLSVSMGQLRSIQIYVVGEARHPGTYTVSSLSTILNAIFIAGGPTPQGSMRHIQVLRGATAVTEFDLYDLVLRGDKSKDVPLEPSDVIFIPTAHAQVAVGGSVRHPAIYEVKDGTTVSDLMELAGGLSAMALDAHVSLERIEDRRVRQAMSIKLDDVGSKMFVRDGDVLFVNSVSDGYEKSVTIRGNLANPGRFPWHQGMHLTDIIPDRMSLLTNDYWRERNQLGLPALLFEPLKPEASDQRRNSSSLRAEGDGPHSPSSIADQQEAAMSGDLSAPAKRVDVKIPVPEIDWSYAVIERLDPDTLKSVLVPFNLGRLVEEHDASQDILLNPGDVVTILSQSDIAVTQDEQTKFVRLEGEFLGSGIYTALPNETLAELVQRAGGLTAKAYLFGGTFTRESARVQQQARLDDYVSSLTISIERSEAANAGSIANASSPAAQYSAVRDMIARLRLMRATGRVVLEFKPESTGLASIRDIPLENGDVFRVPSRPLTVSVVGAVYGQNVYLFDHARRIRDYLLLAGKPNRVADGKHAFLIRADGSIFSKEAAGRSFDSAQVNPGDTIVVPEKLPKPSTLRGVIDYSQIFSQLALGSAAIAVIR